MGRRRTKNKHLPRGVHLKHGRYYYVTTTVPRKWIPLGADLHEACKRWAEIEFEPIRNDDKTFAIIAGRYIREVLPDKAQVTRERDLRAMEVNLLPVFGDVPIDAITPQDIRRYMDLRGKTAPVGANREKALLSHIFNRAREWGYMNGVNPCAGVRSFREAGRDRYVADGELAALYSVADEPLRDALDLAYLTGQRPADVLKMNRGDVQDGHLAVKQNKTGQRLRIAVAGRLAEVLGRIMNRPEHARGVALVQNEQGERLGRAALRSRFDRARRKSGVNFQFRDIRAKAATDTNDLSHAQALLGHQSRDMTEHYVRKRQGHAVNPVR